ncbi:MAG TPA: PilX N-terminal domain-containing pilus assembly protein [Gemmatimonadales bacterium]|nr:PilX N-terminal domain-containing pilus assembly protein [Gemmatimonadales bacterium]
MTIVRSIRGRVTAQEGSALPLALLTMLLLSVLGFALVTLGQTETTIAGNWRSYSAAFYGADAGIESGIVGLRALLNGTPNPSATQLNAIGAPTLNNTSLTFASYAITQTPAPYNANMPTGPYGGLSGLFTDYRIASQVTGPNGTRANLTQTFHYVSIPLFQFAVFYGKGVDLEISPGANMTLNGKVFANSDIYLAPQASTLQIGRSCATCNTLLASAGNMYRTIKRSGSPPTEGFGNNPQIMDASGTYQTLNFDHVDNQNFAGSWTASQWQSAAQSLFGGTVKDSTMGVQQIIPPIPQLFYNPTNPDQVAHQMIELPHASDSTDLAAAKLYSQAGLRIVDGVATDQSGYSVSLPNGAVTTSTFYDGREGNTMQVTNVDISKLPASMFSYGQPLQNGLLYVANSSGGPSAPCAPGTRGPSNPCPAVRLVNGATIPVNASQPVGLTVASQNPVYIQGDYNTTTTNMSGVTTHPPAAVLADAVTVLSNNWNDTNAVNSSSTLSSRAATPTTVNAAIATGPSNESTSGAGNGQLENDIRFLESWSGQTFTYRGSIVDLWHSTQVTAPWQNTGVYYNAPIRNWSYDTLFNTNPPPGTPRGVVMTRGQWSQN